MIGKSQSFAEEYFFIQACILFLHYIAPLCAFYCIIVLVLHPWPYRIPLGLEIWAIAETAFLLLLYYPNDILIQRAAVHPKTASREGRRELFALCKETIQDPDHYLTLWFRKAPLSEIRVENVKQLYRWAFLSKQHYDPADEEELDEYIVETEKLLGRRLQPGRGTAIPLLVTLDKVRTLYRSLFWYLCVFVVDTLTCAKLLWHGFQLHCHWRSFLSVFPLRPLFLFSGRTSPTRRLTYWHRAHRSKSKRPILFIHGIGIGLYPYTNFLSEINENHNIHSDDDEVGIIAIEIMPISFRLTGTPMGSKEMCGEVLKILQYYGWKDIVLVSHSFGSVVSTHLLKDPETSIMIGPVLLIDPVSILLHLPDVAFNFTFRTPKEANEWQLYYFASMDPSVAHTLGEESTQNGATVTLMATGRSFFWSENIFWKKDMQGRRVTVSMSGQDLIVDTVAVGRYLADADGNWTQQRWRGKGLDILWFPKIDHAQVFDTKRDRKTLIDVLRHYCQLTSNTNGSA